MLSAKEVLERNTINRKASEDNKNYYVFDTDQGVVYSINKNTKLTEPMYIIEYALTHHDDMEATEIPLSWVKEAIL